MDLVDRLHHELVEALRRAPAGLDERPLTVGEIYQHLIPYRGVRSELGIFELPQYEHALLRLLSGERGYLTLVAAEVQEELRRELASPNPILGIYRDYPTAEVRLAQQVGPATAPPAPTPEIIPIDEREPQDAPAPEAPRSATCHGCAVQLPDVPELRFCPACGADQLEAPCVACGAMLRAEWNFCIRCGTPRGGGARPQPAQ